MAGLGLALVLGSLSGCGGDPQADYCARLQRDQQVFADLADATTPAPGHRTRYFRDLAAQAPEDLTDEWQTFLNAVQGLADALRRAGVAPADFRGGKPPAGLRRGGKAIRDAADVLSSDEVVSAASGIEQQARDVCKLNLGI